MEYTKADKVEFVSMDAFKERVGETKLELVKSPKTDKLFLSGDKANWKVQKEFDPEMETKVLIPDGNLEQACLVNVKSAVEALHTY
jgi:hypothetical protein